MIYPKSPNQMTKGMAYFPRMLDKIRLHERGELPEEYHNNLGAQRSADGACCNFLRIKYDDLRRRVVEGGTDEEILAWCFKNGRELNEGDMRIWNSFTSKLGWNDFASETLKAQKEKAGLAHRDDIQTVSQLMEIEEGRTK
jgi:hypothetical protein